jgi:hypothetical protein
VMVVLVIVVVVVVVLYVSVLFLSSKATLHLTDPDNRLTRKCRFQLLRISADLLYSITCILYMASSASSARGQ